ncbi:hypothetical protein BTA51_00185 [Hahella sp. CCB-MM4]|uniref:HAD hydrolase family protein n=1 Tax=Hahella sp. (strain CCB-MM4) TaxID=1926491 RepID=UPI000B9AC497|nr:HAD hydrolase family protein [Hahella sp. CCB-MM4]OZG74868.1 hypothetical protein BTA51_00185 [Hahella sp. CCB-MM4]
MFQKFKNIKAVAFDFDGVFTDNSVYVSQHGEETVRCVRSDGIGLSKLKRLGIPHVIISTEANPVVTQRANKLGIDVVQNVERKDVELRKWASEIGVELEDIAFVGNDDNDLDALGVAGIPICVWDATSSVKDVCVHITEARGGHGAVREICELILDSHESDSHDLDVLSVVIPDKIDMGARVWGEETTLALASKKVMMKKLFVKAGCKGGLQYHRKRHEMGYVVSGKMLVRIGDGKNIKEIIMTGGDHYYFPPYLVHQEEAIEDTLIIECSTPWTNDRVRVEAEYQQPDGEVGLRTTIPGEEVLL